MADAWRPFEDRVTHLSPLDPSQIEVVASKPHVLVATPGRLLDLVQSSPLDLGKQTCLESRRGGKRSWQTLSEAAFQPPLSSQMYLPNNTIPSTLCPTPCASLSVQTDDDLNQPLLSQFLIVPRWYVLSN